MKSSIKWIGCGIYLLSVTALFLFLFCPGETLREFAQNRLSRIRPGLSVDIDSVHPSLPPGLRFKTVAIKTDGDRQFTFEAIRFSPEILTLFTRSPAYGFLAEVYDGTVKGRIRVHGNSSEERFSGHARIKGIDIKKVPVSKALSSFSIAGRLQGDFLLNRDSREQIDIDAQLEVEEAAVELTAPLIALKTLSFKSVQVDLKVRSRTLIIRHLSVKGSQLDGRISGSIFLRNDLKQSVLNLNGKIKPHHLLLAGIGKGFQSLLFSSRKKEQDGIPFRIEGTFGSPRFSFEPPLG